MTGRRTRRGFALVLTLWVLVGGAALAMAASLIARDAIGSARNREINLRDSWTARGCLETVRSAIYELLWPDDFTAASVTAVWSALDTALDASWSVKQARCHISVEPTGMTIDVNGASPEQLRRILQRVERNQATVDSLVDALLDWQDADDAPRPLGAERDWYVARGLAPPRNGPFAAVEELRSVRGFTSELAALHLFGVRPNRVFWRRAQPAVVAGLPGMTDEALSVLASHGLSGITDLTAIGGFPEMSAAARDTLARNAPALSQAITGTPRSWRVIVTATTPSMPVEVEAELTVSLGDQHLVILERRVRP